ncbi:MAG: hypothetical protein WCR12_02745 [Dysgonamonadaceae bacterium]
MKKLFLLLIIFPTILFSQENMKKSAEDFVTGYFKLFEDKKWDKIPNMYADDSQVVWLNGKVLPLPESMNATLEKNKIEMTSDNIDVKWMLTDVTGPNTALVTSSYIETTNRSGNIRVTENVGVYLLEQNDGKWQIKKWFPHQNFPLLYKDKIDKRYQIDNIAVIYLASSAINHGWSLICNDIDYFKRTGISPSEYGSMMGERFAKSWDQSVGFNAFATDFIKGLQIMSTYVEVLERNETSFKVKFLSPVIDKNWDVTSKELFSCSRTIWSKIANHMGANCSLDDDGKYWVITMKKK